jgi:membrane-associated phospholipid phosphatase
MMQIPISKAVLRYVSLYLIAGLALSSLCLWLFAELAEDVLAGSPLTAFDLELANSLYLRATPLGTLAFRLVAVFGGTGLIVIGVAVAIALAAQRRWPSLAIWVIALVGGGLLNLQMKELFARPRPVFVTPLHIEQHYSFPSGHAMSSIIAYGVLAYFLWRQYHNQTARLAIVVATIIVVLLIGVSRLALGVHYLSDVIGGFIAGGIWLGVCVAALSILHRGEVRTRARGQPAAREAQGTAE